MKTTTIIEQAKELHGFDEFVDSYLVAIAFTGHRYPTVDCDNPEPLFNTPEGQDFSDYVSADDVRQILTDEQLAELTEDCADFWVDQYQHIHHNPESAGSNFHYTRNGHGCGFWEGFEDPSGNDVGQELTDTAKHYFSCELIAYGRMIDDKYFSDWDGPDADLETSLFEYGLIWTDKNPKSEGDWRFLYPVTHGKPDHFDWADFRKDTDVFSEFDWVNWDSLLSVLGTTKTEFSQLPLPIQIYELVNQHGAENVFGTSYTEGTPVYCSETLKVDIVD